VLFSPGIYEHAAAFLDRTPYEVSRDGDLLAEAHGKAWEIYRHPLIVVGIDIYNLEPEAYGAVIKETTDASVPSLSAHPCKEIAEVLDLAPLDPRKSPRIRETIKAAKILGERCRGARICIPVCGPFALLNGLTGMDETLMAVVEDPTLLKAALDHVCEGQLRYLHFIRDNGFRPVFFESGTTPPLLSADAFQSIEAPALARLFAQSRKLFGEAPACLIGGDAASIARTFLATGPGWVIAPSETDQQAFLGIAGAYPEIHVRVNMKASLLLETDRAIVEKEADRCLRLAVQRENTSLGCGVVPYETDPSLLLHVRNLIGDGRAIPPGISNQSIS
jgi:uroporphyrinogen decarboxylase